MKVPSGCNVAVSVPEREARDGSASQNSVWAWKKWKGNGREIRQAAAMYKQFDTKKVSALTTPACFSFLY